MHARAAFSKATSAFNTVRRLSNSSNSGNRIASFLTKHPPSSSSSSFTNHTKTKTTQSTIVKTMATSSDDAGLVGDVFFLDEFAMRQWDDPAYGGTRINFDKAEFVKRIHEAHAGGAGLVDGYAPFCKHVFVPNFIAGTKVGAIPITEENQHLLRSGYSARSDAELPVLTRWFPEEKVEIPEATFLDIILYSREQLELERSAMASKQERPPLPDAPWGIISVKGQTVDYECPMTPITIMRNALGREEGGSGVPIDREKYAASVEYHQHHAPLVAADSPNGE